MREQAGPHFSSPIVVEVPSVARRRGTSRAVTPPPALRATSPTMGEETSSLRHVSNLLTIFMHGNRRQERSGKFLELGGADAVDLGEFIYIAGAARGHVE